MTDNKKLSIDTFMLSELTGLTHGNIISRVQHLAYDLELSSDEIISMKFLYINDRGIPVVFYQIPDEFRRRLIAKLPVERIQIYLSRLNRLAELSEGELEHYLTRVSETPCYEPIEQKHSAFKGYDVLDDAPLPDQQFLDDGIFRVVRIPSGLGQFSEQTFQLTAILTEKGKEFIRKNIELGNIDPDDIDVDLEPTPWVEMEDNI